MKVWIGSLPTSRRLLPALKKKYQMIFFIYLFSLFHNDYQHQKGFYNNNLKKEGHTETKNKTKQKLNFLRVLHEKNNFDLSVASFLLFILDFKKTKLNKNSTKP